MRKTFSARRIWLVLKRDIMENWRSNLWMALAIYAIDLLYMFTVMPEENTFWYFKLSVADFFLSFCVIIMMVCASMIMKPMATKEKCISYLMLPASRLEKFLARFLCVTVGCLLLSFLAVILADITRILILVPLLHIDEEFYHPVFTACCKIRYTVFFSSFGEAGHLFEFIGTAFMQSFFMLCGCIWRKNAFFKALAIMVAVPIVATVLAGLYLDLDSGIFRWMLRGHPLEYMVWWIDAFLLLLTLLFWYLSYWKFVRKQIVMH